MRPTPRPTRPRRPAGELLRRWVVSAAAAGLLIPLLLLLLAWWRFAPHVDRLWTLLWPFVLMLQPVLRRHPGWSLRDACAMVIGWNMLWYALLGAIFAGGHLLLRFMTRDWRAAGD